MSQQGSLGGGGAGGDLNSLTGNTGGAVGGDAAGNIDIVGTQGITIEGDSDNNQLTISGTTSNQSLTPYFVGPSGQAPYQTIQAAINDANKPAIVTGKHGVSDWLDVVPLMVN